MTAKSKWLSFLDPNDKNDYAHIDDQIETRLEDILSSLTASLLQSEQGWTYDDAKKHTIILVIKKMLEIQYHNDKERQAAMISDLYAHHPQLASQRAELLALTQPKKLSFTQKLFSLFCNN